jgi:hypothetical protein
VSPAFFDESLSELRLDLTRASGRVQVDAEKTLKKGARLVNRAMRVDATGHKGNYFGRPGTGFETPLAQHVSDEMIAPLEAEIGIEAKGAGKLAHIIAYGSVKNAPAYDPGAGLRRSTPEILEMFGEAGEQAVFGEDGVR